MRIFGQYLEQVSAPYAALISFMTTLLFSLIAVLAVGTTEREILIKTIVVIAAGSSWTICTQITAYALYVVWNTPGWSLTTTLKRLLGHSLRVSIKGSFTLMSSLSSGAALSLLYLKICLLTLKRRIRRRLQTNQPIGKPSTVKKSTPFVDPFQFYQSKPNSKDWNGLNSTQTIVKDSKQKQEEDLTTSESLEKSGDQSDSDSQEREPPFHRHNSSTSSATFTLMRKGRFYRSDTHRPVTECRDATRDADVATQ